jgi:transformation/transcription domain-associated protein
MWEFASNCYEGAMTKAKSSQIAFSEVEYCLWEDHWMLAAEKLQQWDTLHDLAKSEGRHVGGSVSLFLVTLSFIQEQYR